MSQDEERGCVYWKLTRKVGICMYLTDLDQILSCPEVVWIISLRLIIILNQCSTVAIHFSYSIHLKTNVIYPETFRVDPDLILTTKKVATRLNPATTTTS